MVILPREITMVTLLIMLCVELVKRGLEILCQQLTFTPLIVGRRMVILPGEMTMLRLLSMVCVELRKGALNFCADTSPLLHSFLVFNGSSSTQLYALSRHGYLPRSVRQRGLELLCR